ncbi:cyclase family protein [Actinopolymorpha alba]|uniref:cyclase family protein n=1 Tax=Actinopolymorpha alba TaxID=533267 RepID=UPI000399B3A1|nr:cyclase family protein [Actinopolymorpha alba]
MTIHDWPAGNSEPVVLSAEEFRGLFQEVSTWGRWEANADRGALNFLTADGVVAAANLVRAGQTVTLARPFDPQARIDNPKPGLHRMTVVPDEDARAGAARLAKDYVGIDYHNHAHTHIDALCYVAFDGLLYDGKPASSITWEGAGTEAIDVLQNGLVGRGVLLDVPRTRRVAWLEPGDQIFPDDLEAAEQSQDVRVRTGDILLVRTGHARRLAELPSWDASKAKAGLHPSCARFLAAREVAALGSDGDSDTAPSSTEGVAFPIHVLAINAMGIHLLDYLELEELDRVCEEMGRWEFLFVAAPLRIPHATGSPVNPLAIF